MVSAAQVCAAALALGRPDPVRAGAFLAGGWPSVEDTLAATQLMVWAIVVVAAAWSFAAMARGVRLRAGRGWEGAVLATGLLILVAGAARHATFDLGMSGGSVQEAQRVLGR
jgi:hypothetical protein